MTFFLELYPPSGVAQRVDLRGGAPLRVGGAGDAELCVVGDEWLAAYHVTFWIDPQGLHVRDLGTPHGIYVNGQGARLATLAEGDTVQAGTTFIIVRSDALSAVTAPSPELQRDLDVAQSLSREEGELFAIVDAARDEAVLPWLLECGAEHRSLYDGWQAQELADVAPYLVSTPRGSKVLSELLARSWGNAWGVFVLTRVNLRDLRRHLRRFLKVSVEEQGQMLFRFYDPRVLRSYLPTCTLEEANAFFGPVECFVVEGHRGESLQRFYATQDGVSSSLQALAPNA